VRARIRLQRRKNTLKGKPEMRIHFDAEFIELACLEGDDDDDEVCIYFGSEMDADPIVVHLPIGAFKHPRSGFDQLLRRLAPDHK
jgi:hypothetical protein